MRFNGNHRHRFSSYLTCVTLMAGGALLSGCSLTDILKDTKTNYTIQASAEDETTYAYLQEILAERVSDKVKTLSRDDDTDLRNRQESYIAQTTRADLIKALHAKGYYAADVKFQEGTEPLSGTYEITYGPQYKISYLDVVPVIYTENLDADAPKQNDILDAQTILLAQNDLHGAIQKDRCYYNLSVNNRVYLDRPRAKGRVEFVVDAGREGKFGTISFQNNGSVKESHLRKFIPWKEGDCFRREKLESYKTALLQSGLFSRAEIILPEEPATDGSVPVTVDLRERAQRTISAGLTYYSDEGPGGVISWEHRNLLGAAEKFKASLNLSMIKQSIDTSFSKPYFLRDDQTLSLSSSLRRQETDAFDELAIDLGGAIDRKFTKHLTGSTGIETSLLRIDDKTENTQKTYGLLSAPQKLNYDTRDDSLDPKKGWNLSATAVPFFDILGEGDPFFKTQLTGSGYLAVDHAAKIVLAAKGSLGGIWGADIDGVPATERFYAGGGGSVRGYGYQEVGPMKDGDPTGGLSLVTLSLELRTKFTDKFGGVAFVDAGSVGEDSTPSFDAMAVGAGIGVRYYTDFGPIRFDIATPLTEKEDLDQNYQFYISIGQAF